MTAPCAACREYRRGERENVTYCGITIHACERKREGTWGFGECVCGCLPRDPSAISTDKLIHGNAFLGPHGERLDPQRIRPAD